MKRCIFIFVMLLCIFPSYAISKKKVLAQRNELISKILKDYKFKSNFDSISVALQTAYDTKAKEIIEKAYATYNGNEYYIYGKQVSTDEYRLYQIKNEEVDSIKLNDKLSLTFKGIHDKYKTDLFWYFEGPYLLKEYPEIREIDSLLSKKKLSNYRVGPNGNHEIVSKWKENIDFNPDIVAAVNKYKIEKSEEKARLQKEKEERIQKEQEAKQREFQRVRNQTPKERIFYAVKYCEHDNTKWGEWKETNKKVSIVKDFGAVWDLISIDGSGYYAKPSGIDKWDCYHEYYEKVRSCQARLIKNKNGRYQLYLDKESGTICYDLEDRGNPAYRAKLSLYEWLIGTWEGKDDGYNYIDIYKGYIKMRLHRYEAVYDYINDIKYQIDGSQIITNLKNGTITIDRSNGCLYFRGVKYTFKPL